MTDNIYANRPPPLMPSVASLRRASEQRGLIGVKKANREAIRRKKLEISEKIRKRLLEKDIKRRRKAGQGQTSFLHGLEGQTKTMFKKQKRQKKFAVLMI